MIVSVNPVLNREPRTTNHGPLSHEHEPRTTKDAARSDPARTFNHNNHEPRHAPRSRGPWAWALLENLKSGFPCVVFFLRLAVDRALCRLRSSKEEIAHQPSGHAARSADLQPRTKNREPAGLVEKSEIRLPACGFLFETGS